MLKITELSKTYDNGVHALRGVNLDIPKGMFGLLGPNGAQTNISFFLTILGADIIISLFALSKTHHRGLGRYTPTLWLYFHLGTLAAFKAGYEMIFSLYFWDKTTHGH